MISGEALRVADLANNEVQADEGLMETTREERECNGPIVTVEEKGEFEQLHLHGPRGFEDGRWA